MRPLNQPRRSFNKVIEWAWMYVGVAPAIIVAHILYKLVAGSMAGKPRS